jgi:predicted DNA-binding transcriptional regulator AlpA
MKSQLLSSTAPPDLLDRPAVCVMFGGTRPIHPSNLYRGIRAGIYPKPIKVGSSSRWLRTECEAFLDRMIGGRS